MSTPITAWGALLIAARLDVYLALQDACWPDRDVPRQDGGIPRDGVTGRPYWDALKRLGEHLGRDAGDFNDTAPDAAAAAAAMRAAASTTPRQHKAVTRRG